MLIKILNRYLIDIQWYITNIKNIKKNNFNIFTTTHVKVLTNNYVSNIIIIYKYMTEDEIMANIVRNDDVILKKETKREKFVRLAEARTNKILDMLQLLGNCSNTNIYDYTQKDVEKIFAAIESEVKETKKKFNKMDNKKDDRFTLE